MIDLCDNLFDIYIIHELTDRPSAKMGLCYERIERKKKRKRYAILRVGLRVRACEEPGCIMYKC